jgi:hypothetical protein
MKKILIALFAFLSQGCVVPAVKATFPELEVIQVLQLDPAYTQRFDLSGIVESGNRLYVVADKEHNPYIYEIAMGAQHWFLADSIRLPLQGEIGLEALDVCNGLFYLADEDNTLVYTSDREANLNKVPVGFAQAGIDPSSWKANTGLEGLAVDCRNNIMYLAKEREPRFIMKVDLKSGRIVEQFNIPETESNDIADMKFENGFLYLVERNGNYITKVNPVTKKVVAKASFKQVVNEQVGIMYEPTRYGMAEALLLTPNEIWIGIDNNYLSVSEQGKLNFGLEGRNPVIIRFKRPKGF